MSYDQVPHPLSSGCVPVEQVAVPVRVVWPRIASNGSCKRPVSSIGPIANGAGVQYVLDSVPLPFSTPHAWYCVSFVSVQLSCDVALIETAK